MRTHSELIKKKLRAIKSITGRRIGKKHPQVISWLKKRNIGLGNLRKYSKEWLSGATLASAMLLNQAGVSGMPVKMPPSLHAEATQAANYEKMLVKLNELLPENGMLDSSQETKMSEALEQLYDIKAVAKLDGKHLNHQYGRMGKEQHLKRFPGDMLALQGEQKASGIAPGLGAWGYFADSKQELTAEDIMREKYYVAVQTLYLPDWNVNFRELREWYKYRKVLVVNPENGKAVVAVIGDAGPARWTGKVFGGSPEVVEELKLDESENKGKVVLLFVDDPENQVPLGPVGYIK